MFTTIDIPLKLRIEILKLHQQLVEKGFHVYCTTDTSPFSGDRFDAWINYPSTDKQLYMKASEPEWKDDVTAPKRSNLKDATEYKNTLKKILSEYKQGIFTDY